MSRKITCDLVCESKNKSNYFVKYNLFTIDRDSQMNRVTK